MEYFFAEEFEFILTSLLQISNRTTFFQSISCKFDRSVYLRKKLGMPIPAQNGRQILLIDVRRTWTHRRGGLCGCFCSKIGVMYQQLWRHHCAITVNSWHLLPRNFKLKIICQLCSILMTSHNEHSVSREEVYVDRGSLTWWLANPSDELSNFSV